MASPNRVRCKCGVQSGCKTARCDCAREDASCGSDCSCGKECTRRYKDAGRDSVGAADIRKCHPLRGDPINGGAGRDDVPKRPAAKIRSDATDTPEGCAGDTRTQEGSFTSTTARTSSAAAAASPAGLRDNVSKLTDKIWTYRDNVDAYTKISRQKYSDSVAAAMENDHVWEIQVLEAAQSSLGPAYNTRAVTSNLKIIANNVCNLNVTTKELNQAKKGPFTLWCRNYGTPAVPISLDDAIDRTSSHYGRKMKDLGYWDNVKKEVVKTNDKMTGYLDDPAQIIRGYTPSQNMAKAAETFQEELDR